MNLPLPPAPSQPALAHAESARPGSQRNWARRLVNLLVALVVIAVAGATFVFSYPGVHAIALEGGVSTQLARFYPGLFDAVLVIACVAAVMLHGGRWWARLWAWLVIIVVLAAIGWTDVVHAMNYTLRHRPTEGAVAAAPVVAVLLAFSLLLTLLRQSRSQAPRPASGRRTRRNAGYGDQQQAVTAPLSVMSFPVTISAADAPTIETPIPPASPPIRLPAPSIALPPASAAPEPASAPEGPLPEAALGTGEDDVFDVAPTPAERVPADAQEASATQDSSYPATEPVEAIAGASLAADPAPVPPLTQDADPASEAEPARARTTQGIRYASHGAVARTDKPASEPTAAAERPDALVDYWDAEDAGQYAGLVYAAREDIADANDAAGEDNTAGDSGRPAPRRQSPELHHDASPFATAPFASVPRLNRVRSMPARPADDED